MMKTSLLLLINLLIFGSECRPTYMTNGNPRHDSVMLPPLVYPSTLGHNDFSKSSDGTYYFQYDTGSDGPASFRGETRDLSGAVTGYFGYIDPDGVLRITHYKADTAGFRSTTTLRYLRSEGTSKQI